MSKRAESAADGWVQWIPATEKSADKGLSKAIQDFEPLPNEAGSACARWLKESSLMQWPQTVTWVLYRNGLVEGFIAMRSGIVELDIPRKKVWEKGETVPWPCTVVEWMCRRAGDDFDGKRLINQAIYKATQVGETQGNAALVIEPFSPRIREILLREHDYLRRTGQGHLWLPLNNPEDHLLPSLP
jgi:hypothetical protein